MTRARRFGIAALALVAVCSSAVMVSPRPASAANLASARARAAALYQRVQVLNQQVDTLGQRANLAAGKLYNLEALIAHSQQAVAAAQQQVLGDRVKLRQAAINAYINAGATAQTNPLFTSDASSIGARKVYNNVAEGNLTSSVSHLRLSQIQLTQQRALLRAQTASAQQTAHDAATLLHNAQRIQAQAQALYNGAKGEVAYFLRQAQLAAEAASAAAWAKAHNGKPRPGFPAPPGNSRAAIAVRFALSMLGVPYVWGGASRYGVDCSGLTMLSWRAAGIYLPHYSGAQMASMVYVPLYALQPGDLLFYGPGGGSHVAMYIGHNAMIEAPTFGQRVHITGIRLGWGFAGARRPRG